MTALALAFALAFGGFAALSATMRKHVEQIWRRRTKPGAAVRLALRALAALCVLASAIACVELAGLAIGIVLWFGVLTAAAFLLAMTLTLLPPAAADARKRARR